MDSFSSEKIKYLLLYEKTKYKIIKNDHPSNACWWRAFGYPAQLNINNEFKRINGFISCFNYMSTNIYNKLSATKRFKEHPDKCSPLAKVDGIIFIFIIYYFRILSNSLFTNNFETDGFYKAWKIHGKICYKN